MHKHVRVLSCTSMLSTREYFLYMRPLSSESSMYMNLLLYCSSYCITTYASKGLIIILVVLGVLLCCCSSAAAAAAARPAATTQPSRTLTPPERSSPSNRLIPLQSCSRLGQ